MYRASLLLLGLLLAVNCNDEEPNPADRLGIEFVTVEGGSFMMGSPDSVGSSDEHPQHQVTLSSFKISKYEVTAGQYLRFLDESGLLTNPYPGIENSFPYFYPEEMGLIYTNGYWKIVEGKSDFPMIMMTWYGARAFCSYYSLRLPTEAEWEFAARGGKLSKGYLYSGSNDPDDVAWFEENSGDSTHVVGSKNPNELGLYDMSGNVWEWCSDWYDLNYYSYSTLNNPSGAQYGIFRLLRGGAWIYSEIGCRVATRDSDEPWGIKNCFGFRCAADVR